MFLGPIAARKIGICSWTGAIVSFSALPGPSGSGSVSVSPSNSTRSRASAIRTTAMYSRVRWSCLAKRWPCQPSATCGPEEPIPSSMRPPESWSSVAAVMAVMAAERPGIWRIAEPSLIFVRGLREPAEDRRRVGPVGLRGPHRVVAERLRLEHELELLVRGQAEAPVPDVHAQFHPFPPPRPWPSLPRCAESARPYQPVAYRNRLSPGADPRGDARRRARQHDRRRRLHRRPRRHLPDARRAPQRRPHGLPLVRPRVGRLRAGHGGAARHAARAARARGPARGLAGRARRQRPGRRDRGARGASSSCPAGRRAAGDGAARRAW